MNDVKARHPVLRAWVVIVSVLGFALAGCGGEAGSGGEPSASGVAVASASGTATLAGNRAAATREAARLLRLAAVPAHAVEMNGASGGSSPAGSALGRPAVQSLVDRTRVWQVDLPFAQALAWLKAHPPAGLTVTGLSSSSGTGNLTPGNQSAGLGYGEPGTAQWTGAELQIGVTSLGASRTVIRADALAVWLDPTPYRDTLPGRRLRVTVADGCPATDRRVVGVTNSGPGLTRALLPAGLPGGGLICRYTGLNAPASTLARSVRLDPATARHIAAALQELPLGHEVGEITNCPMDDGSASLIVLTYAGQSDIDLWYSSSGCPAVANGFISAGTDNGLATIIADVAG